MLTAGNNSPEMVWPLASPELDFGLYNMLRYVVGHNKTLDSESIDRHVFRTGLTHSLVVKFPCEATDSPNLGFLIYKIRLIAIETSCGY